MNFSTLLYYTMTRYEIEKKNCIRSNLLEILKNKTEIIILIPTNTYYYSIIIILFTTKTHF